MGLHQLDVLVVDDQPGVRQLLDIVITQAGHRVHTAQNGLEALEKVRSVRPQVVFMDVRMPLMDGLEALRRIRRMAPETRVVIMTAYISEHTVKQAMEEGAICCLVKPFDIREVVSLVENLACQHYQKSLFLKGCVV